MGPNLNSNSLIIVKVIMNHLTTFQSVRDYSSRFVSDRNWKQFHTPLNVALALSGECGELSEIFQWKGPILRSQIDGLLDEKELIHISEEISDVFIYSSRLCDLCDIDLPRLVYDQLVVPPGHLNADIYSCNPKSESKLWYLLKFDDFNDLINDIPESQSIRVGVLKIQSYAGVICSLFANKPEEMSIPSISSWSKQEIYQLGSALASLCIHLGELSKVLKFDLGRSITEKYKKNEAKYPVELVKGSSAKYTAYVDQIAKNGDK